MGKNSDKRELGRFFARPIVNKVEWYFPGTHSCSTGGCPHEDICRERIGCGLWVACMRPDIGDVERLMVGISDWRGLALIPDFMLDQLREALVRYDKTEYAPVIAMIDAARIRCDV